MNVSTRIIFGIGVLMVLALLALGYQVYINKQLELVNHELSEVNLQATHDVVLLGNAIPVIDQFSRKYFVVDRERYGEGLEAWRRDFESDLAELQRLPLSVKEKADLALVAQAWDDYRRQWAIELEQNPVGKTENFSFDLYTRLEAIPPKIEKLDNTIQAAVTERVRETNAMGARAQRISWITGSMALVVGGLISILLLRTISRSVRQLTQGTRDIAQGKFSHRIPATGRDEFAELARDFNAMSQRLGELDQMKKDFVSHVSHDLKAPLASIRQTAHLLLEQIPGPLNDQQKRLLRLSYNSAERLAAMVGNLLDVSRLEAGSMEYAVAPVDLLALVNTVMEEFQLQANDKHITIRLESPSKNCPLVPCDRDRMVQVIGNLIENALKFSPQGSEIVISLDERVEENDPIVVFSIADQGTGVDDAHKERIFEKFHQVKHGKKIQGQGVGLGLAICKSIIEAHQGKIWVKDNPSGGSVFSFQLQATARAEVAHAAEVR
jgi:signal transduction histidine kinase